MHNLCLSAKTRKMYTPVLLYKWYKEVYITRTCSYGVYKISITVLGITDIRKPVLRVLIMTSFKINQIAGIQRNGKKL